jgi:hypothetical protein
MFMMQGLEKLKNLINSFINMEDKKKQKEMVFSLVAFIIVLSVIFSTYEFSKKTLSYIYPAGNNFDNLYYLILSFN